MAQQRIGRYHVVEEIASGGQGTVYRAFAPDTSATVAIKTLHGDLSRDDQFFERFRREAQMIASLDHPNVVQIHEVGEHDSKPFVALEYLPDNLTRLIETVGPLPVNQAADIAAQIVGGLAAAHAAASPSTGTTILTTKRKTVDEAKRSFTGQRYSLATGGDPQRCLATRTVGFRKPQVPRSSLGVGSNLIADEIDGGHKPVQR